MAIKRVWIEEGCISCNLCEDLCPEVFEVPIGGDCQPTANHRSYLGSPEKAEQIQEACDACPVEVIQLEKD